jgi:hypothetical protein
MLVQWEINLMHEKRFLPRTLSQFGLSLCKFVLNLFFVLPPIIKHEVSPTWTSHDIVFGVRETGWSRILLPYLFANHDGEYLLIPNTENYQQVQLVAQTLAYEKLAVLLNLNVNWTTISAKHSAADRFAHIFPNISEIHFSVYKLTADFAQAIRLHILGFETQKLRI